MPGTIAPPVPTIGQPNSTEDSDLREAIITLRDAMNAVFNSSNKIDPALFLPADRPKLKWYTKVIAGEESRANTAYGTLPTADEVSGVVVPENGLILLGYAAKVKASVASNGYVGIFLNSNQLKANNGEDIHTITTGLEFNSFLSTQQGLARTATPNAFVGTGQTLATSPNEGGLCTIVCNAGTYNISVRYKALSGSISAKERKLWVAVLG
jgi:hypothetical protein